MRLETGVTSSRNEETQGGAGFWRALVLALAGLALFVLIFNFLLPDAGAELPPTQLALLGMLLASVPAALWLVFFYRFDHRSPEPRWLVLLVFAGGAVLCAALYGPVLRLLLPAEQMLLAPWWTRLAEAILIAGVLETTLIYLAVRVLAFHRHEFDERVDGVIYGVAAGLGLATVINFGYVLAHGGVDLDVGSVRMVVNTLAYASAGGVLGYFVGQARFERVPWYYLPGGLTIAAAMLGALFTVLEPASTGLQPRAYWVDLALATSVAVVAMVAVFVLIARAHEETARIERDEPRPMQPAPAFWQPTMQPSSGPLAAAADRGPAEMWPEPTFPAENQSIAGAEADASPASPPPPNESIHPPRPEKGNPFGAQ